MRFIYPPLGTGRFAPGYATGSRERAPDDRLHIVQCKSGEGIALIRATATPHPNLSRTASRACPTCAIHISPTGVNPGWAGEGARFRRGSSST
jgi:hypothetical protein